MKVLIVVLVVFVIAGCSNERNERAEQDPFYSLHRVGVTHFTTEAGVECIKYQTTYGVGVSCNWAKYNEGKNNAK